MDGPPAKRQRAACPPDAKRQRPQLDILFGNGEGDIGVIKERVRCKDIREEITQMTEVMRDPADPYKVLYKGITVADRIACLARSWVKGVAAARTPTGVVVLNDANFQWPEKVQDTYHFLLRAGLDVEYIPPTHYAYGPHISADFDFDRHGKYFMWSGYHSQRFNRGIVAGIRLLNEEGQLQQSKRRQVERMRAFEEELMARCWHPSRALMQAEMADMADQEQ